MNVLKTLLFSIFFIHPTHAASVFEPNYDWTESNLDSYRSFRETYNCYSNLGAQGELNLKVYLFTSIVSADFKPEPAYDRKYVDQVYVIHYPNQAAFVKFTDDEYFETERRRYGYSSYHYETEQYLIADMNRYWGALKKDAASAVQASAYSLLKTLFSEKADEAKLSKLPAGAFWTEDYPHPVSMVDVYAADSGISENSQLPNRAKVIAEKHLRPIFRLAVDERHPESDSKLVFLKKNGKTLKASMKASIPLRCESVTRRAVNY